MLVNTDNELINADRLGAADHADDRLAAHALDLGIQGDHGRECAGEIGTLLLLEEHRGDVRARLHLVENDIVRAGVVLRNRLQRIAVRILEVDDQAKAGVRCAAQDVCSLGHHVLRFDGLAFELVLSKRLLESGMVEIVV